MARGPTVAAGVWKKDSVKDVAESIGIANLPDEVASALAGDVEYRLWEMIEESIKFMRHSRRTRLKVEDVDNALRVRNIEPLWGFASSSNLPFKKTVTSTGVVYHVEDEEIDLSKAVKVDLPAVPREVSFTAHWLAIEGVQPLIKENPTPAELAKYAPKTSLGTNALGSGSTSTDSAAQGGAIVTPLVKHVLSRELQLYFTRLTDALATTGSGAGSEMREAALGSVRSDPGLHQLVPYLIQWGGERIATHLNDLTALERALDLFHAMLENPTLFIEPYLHQLTPPVLTCLLTSSLPQAGPNSYPIPLTIRTSAASLLHLILSRHSDSYPSLRPRITRTLLRGLAGQGRGLGARWGAARGLAAIGSNGATGVREWLGGGLKSLGETLEAEEESEAGEREQVVREVFNALKASLLPSDLVSAADGETEVASLEQLEERYGRLFGKCVLERWDQGGKDVWKSVSGGPKAEAKGDAMEE
ncbi:BZ3500_MvSof-1268-A1-R1_Chr4-3g07417 [Microbotryum saponariae]|uniref:TBP-associated factor 6 n=1 Tax=Microbotryum saponariae TaxID=289078 RepID=A0A2X0L0C0_9BASI|nr:BZ3500_MvSof-1268-A1-R1_Chr4-3g07417 [Microbotryum saponariae]SDA07080.1 BZ3501_MvSof-1269-A2-R1_Chr4-2g07126 [Microbotryum saponariae]